jgi:mevalonate kinase
MKTKEIAEFAFQVERHDLGIMCGRMDQYSIAYGGVTFIETGEQTQVTKISSHSLPFVIGDSVEPRQAKVILNKTMKLLEEKDPEFLECFDAIHENVLIGYNAVQTSNFKLLGQLMNKHQEIERKMGASTPRIDAMCEEAIKAGAIEAKQIGAGGGGCIIALAPENTKTIIDAIQRCGGRAWSATLFK